METQQCPHLVALSVDDPLATGILLYYLNPGSTVLGRANSNPLPDIELSGSGVADTHCTVEFDGLEKVTLLPAQGQCLINGRLATGEVELMQGQTLQLGENNIFRFNHPAQVGTAGCGGRVFALTGAGHEAQEAARNRVAGGHAHRHLLLGNVSLVVSGGWTQEAERRDRKRCERGRKREMRARERERDLQESGTIRSLLFAGC